MTYRNATAGTYFAFPRAAAQDERLSHRALGILVYITSHYTGWKANEQDIIRSHKEGAYACRQAIAELIRYGYVNRVEEPRGADGLFTGWRLDFYDDPMKNPAYNPNVAERVCPVTNWPERAPEEPAGEPVRDYRYMEPVREIRALVEPVRDFRDGSIYIEDQDRSIGSDLLLEKGNAAAAAQHRPAQAQTPPPIKKIPNLKTKKPKAAKTYPLTRTSAQKLRDAVDNSPYLRKELFTPAGNFPQGQGQTVVEMYYEFFSILNPKERLDNVMEDDLVRCCPNGQRTRDALQAYKRKGNYQPRNLQLIIDWSNNPALYLNPRTSNGAATQPAPQPGASQPPAARPAQSAELAEFRAAEEQLRRLSVWDTPPA